MNHLHDIIAWTADSNLRVTSLTARLRELVGVGPGPVELHVGELWADDDAFNLAVLAHRFALDGEGSHITAARSNILYRLSIDPFFDAAGKICGVTGTAVPQMSRSTDFIAQQALEALENGLALGWWYHDAQREAVAISPSLHRLYGISEQTALDIRSFDHPEDREAVAEAIMLGELSGDGYTYDHRVVRGDGHVRVFREHERSLYDTDGTRLAWVGYVIDMTDLRAREDSLARLAHYDSLTSLPNRTLMSERIDSTLANAKTGNATCALIFIDLDNFKGVNDEYGHALGDRLLSLVGRRLERHVRGCDMIARWSGDEFVVLADNVPDRTTGESIASSLLATFTLPFALDGRSILVCASVGVAMCSPHMQSADQFIAQADRAMYAAKRAGGATIRSAEGSAECVRFTEPLSLRTRGERCVGASIP